MTVNLPLNRSYTAKVPVAGTNLAALEEAAVAAGVRLAGSSHEVVVVELAGVQPQYSDNSSWRADATITLDPLPAEEPEPEVPPVEDPFPAA